MSSKWPLCLLGPTSTQLCSNSTELSPGHTFATKLRNHRHDSPSFVLRSCWSRDDSKWHASIRGRAATVLNCSKHSRSFAADAVVVRHAYCVRTGFLLMRTGIVAIRGGECQYFSYATHATQENAVRMATNQYASRIRRDAKK